MMFSEMQRRCAGKGSGRGMANGVAGRAGSEHRCMRTQGRESSS